MTTPTTPERAMELAAEHDSDTPTHAALISLAKQVEALTAERDGLTQAVIDRDSITRGLLERIDKLKPDADRYQWLRNLTRGHRGACFDQMWFLLPDVKRIPGQNIMQGSVAQHLDAAIDAAMKAAS